MASIDIVAGSGTGGVPSVIIVPDQLTLGPVCVSERRISPADGAKPLSEPAGSGENVPVRKNSINPSPGVVSIGVNERVVQSPTPGALNVQVSGLVTSSGIVLAGAYGTGAKSPSPPARNNVSCAGANAVKAVLVVRSDPFIVAQ